MPQVLTFMPARTRLSLSQNAIKLKSGHLAAKDGLVVGAWLDVAEVLHAEVVLIGVEVPRQVVAGG
jgi:hypothetical protein